MLQPALLAVIRSGRQEKYPNGLHQAGVKDSKTQLSCGPQDGSGTTPPRTHMPMDTHLLKPSKEFRVNNLCNDSLHPHIYRDFFFIFPFWRTSANSQQAPGASRRCWNRLFPTLPSPFASPGSGDAGGDGKASTGRPLLLLLLLLICDLSPRCK